MYICVMDIRQENDRSCTYVLWILDWKMTGHVHMCYGYRFCLSFDNFQMELFYW
jgi:hypothetical protein